MIINWGRKSVKISEGRNEYCQKCDAERPFSIFLSYKVFGVFWVFLVSWSKVYTYCCNLCLKGWKLPEEASTEIENKVLQHGKSPIPFLHRFGLGLFLGVTIAISTYIGYLDDKRQEEFDAYINNGKGYSDTGEFDKAVLEFTKAIELDPDNPDGYSGRGLAYVLAKEYDKSFADLNTVITIVEDSSDKVVYTNPEVAYFYRGVGYMAKGNHNLAIEDFSKAIELNPDYADAYQARGRLSFTMGKDRQAFADYAMMERLKNK